MSLTRNFFSSTLSKKYLMALTGLALTGFVIAHLVGNLQLLIPKGDLFNRYALHLTNLGPFLWATEIGLLAITLAHVLAAVLINLGVLDARPKGYAAALKTKGGPIRNTVSSRHMLIIGAVVFAFMVVHVAQFKYGPNIKQGYSVAIDGEMVRNLHRLVVETFSNGWWVLFYTACMVFLGYHLRHGVWSAFQSLGAMPAPLSNLIYVAGVVLAILLAIGFIFLPAWIYFDFLGVY